MNVKFEVEAFAGQRMAVVCPDSWVERVYVIVDRGATVYGPKWNPGVVECLQRMTDGCEAGYTVAAYDHLVRAETKLGITPVVLAS